MLRIVQRKSRKINLEIESLQRVELNESQIKNLPYLIPIYCKPNICYL